jgi:hypothetical protein
MRGAIREEPMNLMVLSVSAGADLSTDIATGP